MLSFFCLPPASIFQSLLAVDLVFFSESGVQIPKYSRMKLVLHHSCSVNLSQEQCSDAVGKRERCSNGVRAFLQRYSKARVSLWIFTVAVE